MPSERQQERNHVSTAHFVLKNSSGFRPRSLYLCLIWCIEGNLFREARLAHDQGRGKRTRGFREARTFQDKYDGKCSILDAFCFKAYKTLNYSDTSYFFSLLSHFTTAGLKGLEKRLL